MTKDFTSGSPFKQIFFFSLPFLIGNLFQQFYNIVDTIIVGRVMNADALAAVGSTGGIIWFFCGFICCLAPGFSAFVSQCFGAHRPEKVKHAFGMSIILSAIICVILTIISCTCAMPILKFLRTPYENDIIYMAHDYVIWVFAAIPGTMLFNLLSNIIRALGDSKNPLYFLIASCVINIILDILLVPILGTAGAGLATALAQLSSGIMCVIYIVKKQPALHIKRRHLRLNGFIIMQLLRIGIPMGLLNIILSLGSIATQFASNTLGNVYMASQTAATKIEQFVTQPLIAIGNASMVFTAQNYGAKKYDRIIKGTKITQLIGLTWCAILTVIMLLFGKFFLSLVVGPDETEIINNGFTYIIINTICCFIVSPLIICKAFLQSLGRVTAPIISGPLEIVGRAIASIGALIIFKDPIMQYLGVCLSNPIAWALGLIPLLIDYIIKIKNFKNLMFK